MRQHPTIGRVLLADIGAEHPVEKGGAGQRADHVVVGPHAQRALAIVHVVLFENDGDMGMAGEAVRAQAAAEFEAGHFRQHPVDEHPERPFDQRQFGKVGPAMKDDIEIVVPKGGETT